MEDVRQKLDTEQLTDEQLDKLADETGQPCSCYVFFSSALTSLRIRSS